MLRIKSMVIKNIQVNKRLSEIHRTLRQSWKHLGNSMTEPAQNTTMPICSPWTTSAIYLKKHRKAKAGILVVAHMSSRTSATWQWASEDEKTAISYLEEEMEEKIRKHVV